MPAVEDAVRRFDVPAAAPKNVELIAYFLIASDKEPAAGGPVPPELDAVIKQLRSVFAYKSFAVLDSLLIRTGSGQGGNVAGSAPPAPGAPPTSTMFRVQRWALRAGEKGDVITIEKLATDLRLPVSTGGFTNTGIHIDRVDVPVGQKVVVGKSGLEDPGKALVIVLSAKVL